MRYIKCTVKNEFVSGAGQVIGAAGSHHDVALRITFGEMWDGLSMYVTFRDALGENPTVVQILPTNLVLGTERTYDVVVPAAPKAKQGKAMVTVQGYTVVGGTQEASATNAATAYFTVLPSDYALADDESIDATLAQQLQAEIDEIRETVTDARLAAKDAEAWAVGQIEGADVPETDERYENNSKYYAQRADESAAAAEIFKNLAANMAGTAAEKAMDAINAASDAQTSANSAATSAQDAETSADSAATSAQDAELFLTNARYYSQEAYISMNYAAESAAAASQSESAAATSASAAATNAGIAQDGAAAASQSESAAATSAAAAKNSESISRRAQQEIEARITEGLDRGLLTVKTVTTVLTVTGWNGTGPYTQTLSFDEGVLALNQSGGIHLAAGATEEQVEAEADAVLMVTQQQEGRLTITAYGVLPTVDLPVELHLYFNVDGLMEEIEADVMRVIRLGLHNALRFSADEGFVLETANGQKNWNGILEWTDGESDWAEWDGTSISSGKENKLYVRGTGNTYITNLDLPRKSWKVRKKDYPVPQNAAFRCTGNIEMLLDYATAAAGGHPQMAAQCFRYMFYDTGIVQAPDLNAITLSEYCYADMFTSCKALKDPPVIRATTLARGCCSNMFSNTEMEKIVIPPAKVMAESCYAGMYSNSGVYVDETYDAEWTPYPFSIPPTMDGTDATNALNNMFQNYSSPVVTPTLNRTYYSYGEVT